MANNLKNKLRAVKQETYQHYLSQLSKTDHTIWKVTKKGKQPQITNSPIRKSPDEWARSDQEKAEVFAHHFKNVFTPHSDDPNPDIENFLETPLQMSVPIKNVTSAEIREQIKNLNKKKSPGYDLINGKVSSELPVEGIKFLTLLFNAILRLKYWPMQLTFGQIILIQKPGKPPHEVNS